MTHTHMLHKIQIQNTITPRRGLHRFSSTSLFIFALHTCMHKHAWLGHKHEHRYGYLHHPRMIETIETETSDEQQGNLVSSTPTSSSSTTTTTASTAATSAAAASSSSSSTSTSTAPSTSERLVELLSKYP
ncbi:uncharacterized protein LOC100501437 [Zea mays]|uniref:Uncharacterized protein n=1 Tax=Zea mays TaxID=4577 RepID=C4J3A5_MAIZE|nr:uncharacterized protein LOC100501437 [Zea mays]ACR35655.1 unknown [Zea mays]|eukprot:NP_001183081.1 uncharacterized protein LOC100501437 [Zea mays]